MKNLSNLNVCIWRIEAYRPHNHTNLHSIHSSINIRVKLLESILEDPYLSQLQTRPCHSYCLSNTEIIVTFCWQESVRLTWKSPLDNSKYRKVSAALFYSETHFSALPDKIEKMKKLARISQGCEAYKFCILSCKFISYSLFSICNIIDICS